MFRDRGDTTWMARSACIGADPEMFFPEEKGMRPHPYARKLCTGCPVINQCLEYALRNPDEQGLWGGTTDRDRETIRRRRRADSRAERGAA